MVEQQQPLTGEQLCCRLATNGTHEVSN